MPKATTKTAPIQNPNPFPIQLPIGKAKPPSKSKKPPKTLQVHKKQLKTFAKDLAKKKAPFQVAAYTIVNGKHQDLANQYVQLSMPSKKGAKISFTFNGKTLDIDKVELFVTTLWNMSWAESTYRNVKNEADYEKIYSVHTYNLLAGAPAVPVSMPAQPCVNCSVIFPERNITIDHIRPQSIGETEAVAKVFRTFGLTLGTSIGEKNMQLEVRYSLITPALNPPALGPVSVGKKSKLDSPTLAAARYTLNDHGTLLYSLFVALGYQKQLESACMHSMINLRPMCGTCNSERGNPPRKYS